VSERAAPFTALLRRRGLRPSEQGHGAWESRVQSSLPVEVPRAARRGVQRNDGGGDEILTTLRKSVRRGLEAPAEHGGARPRGRLRARARLSSNGADRPLPEEWLHAAGGVLEVGPACSARRSSPRPYALPEPSSYLVLHRHYAELRGRAAPRNFNWKARLHAAHSHAPWPCSLGRRSRRRSRAVKKGAARSLTTTPPFPLRLGSPS